MNRIERQIKKIVTEVCDFAYPNSITIEHNLMRDLGANYEMCKEIKEQIEVCLDDDDAEIVINPETTIKCLINQVKIYC